MIPFSCAVYLSLLWYDFVAIWTYCNTLDMVTTIDADNLVLVWRNNSDTASRNTNCRLDTMRFILLAAVDIARSACR
jgi:hypothetical protein